MLGCLPDDPRIINMDLVQKHWMFHNWVEDQNDNAELAKNHAYLLASFDHPDAVKQMTDDTNGYESSDEEYEESLELVKNFKLPETEQVIPGRRRKRKLKE